MIYFYYQNVSYLSKNNWNRQFLFAQQLPIWSSSTLFWCNLTIMISIPARLTSMIQRTTHRRSGDSSTRALHSVTDATSSRILPCKSSLSSKISPKKTPLGISPPQSLKVSPSRIGEGGPAKSGRVKPHWAAHTWKEMLKFAAMLCIIALFIFITRLARM